MILLFLVSILSPKIFFNSDEQPIKKYLKRKDLALILFYSGKFPKLSEYEEMLQSLYLKFQADISIAAFSYHQDSDFINEYQIELNPEIIIFKSSQFCGKYQGEWTEDALKRFVLTSISRYSNIIPIQNISKFYEFKNPLLNSQRNYQSQSNIVFYGSKYTPFFNDFMNFVGPYHFFLKVGMVSNNTFAKSIGVHHFPMIQINRPFDEVTYQMLNYSRESFLLKIRPSIKLIHYNQVIGLSIYKRYALFSLIQGNSYYQNHDVSRIMKSCGIYFKDDVIFEYGEYIDFYPLTIHLNITNITRPSFIFFASSFLYPNDISKDNYQTAFLYKGRHSPFEIRTWLKRQINVFDTMEQISKSDELKIQKVIPFVSLSHIDELISSNGKKPIFVLYGNPLSSRSSEYIQKYKLLCQTRDILYKKVNTKFFLLNKAAPNTNVNEFENIFNYKPQNKNCVLLIEKEQKGIIVIEVDSNHGLNALLKSSLKYIKQWISADNRNYLKRKVNDSTLFDL